MADDNDKRWSRIPIRFIDDENEEQALSPDANPADMDRIDPDSEPTFRPDTDSNQEDDSLDIDLSEAFDGGPATAELVAGIEEDCLGAKGFSTGPVVGDLAGVDVVVPELSPV